MNKAQQWFSVFLAVSFTVIMSWVGAMLEGRTFSEMLFTLLRAYFLAGVGLIFTGIIVTVIIGAYAALS